MSSTPQDERTWALKKSSGPARHLLIYRRQGWGLWRLNGVPRRAKCRTQVSPSLSWLYLRQHQLHKATDQIHRRVSCLSRYHYRLWYTLAGPDVTSDPSAASLNRSGVYRWHVQKVGCKATISSQSKTELLPLSHSCSHRTRMTHFSFLVPLMICV